MEFNRAALAGLAVIGIVAAGGGAYIANRNVEMRSVAAVKEVPASTVAGSVNETENSITPAPAPAVTVAQAAPGAPSKPVVSAGNVPRKQPAAPTRTTPPADYQGSAYPVAPVAAPAPANPPVAAAIEPLESTTIEKIPQAPEPPQKLYEELVVPADSVIGLQIETAVTSERAKVEDPVRARVTRDVKVRDHVVIPAGARAEGSITLVEKGGRLKDQARLGIRFHTLVLADGTRLPITTETIYRDGESPVRESAAKIGGGAVGGAVLGAILGGKKGAIIGSTVGASAGGAAVAASGPSAATIAAGSTITVRMSAPTTVTVEK